MATGLLNILFTKKIKKNKLPQTFNNKDLLNEFKSNMESSLSEQEIDIITKRSGLITSSKTLEEIGTVENVTRERIRQIEKRGKEKMIKVNPEWYKKVIKKCDELFDKYLDQNMPTNVKSISDSDQYFKGVDDKHETFKYILENFLPKKYFLVLFNDNHYVTKLKQQDFQKILSNLKSKFKNNDITSFKNIMDKELSLYSLSMMADLILEQFNINFSSHKMRLIEILKELGKPIHFDELFKLYNDKFHEVEKSRDIQAKLNHYTDTFFCFKRGVWGLKEHLNIHENEQLRICNLVENFIINSPNGQYYQWSCDDLKEKLKLPYDEYEINICLQLKKEKIEYLGRNVWSMTKSDRLEFHDLTVQILKTSGRPMQVKEIKEIISKRRSSTGIHQIHAKPPIKLIGRGFFGHETVNSKMKYCKLLNNKI